MGLRCATFWPQGNTRFDRQVFLCLGVRPVAGPVDKQVFIKGVSRLLNGVLLLMVLLFTGCQKAPPKTQPPPPAAPPQLSVSKPGDAINSEEFGRLQSTLQVAAVYRSRGMLEQAQAEIKRLLPTLKNPLNRTRTLFELSQIYVAQGKLEDAAQLFVKNPSKEPRADAFGQLYLAGIRKMQGRGREAEKLYQGLLKHPWCQRDLSLLSSVTAELSQLYASQGRTAEAIALYQKTLSSIPAGAQRSVESGKAAAQARLQMAGFHLQRGTAAQALPLLQEVLGATAGNPSLQGEQASATELYTEALKKAGRYEEAAQHLRQRLATAPATHLFGQLLEVSDRLMDTGKPAQAQEQYDWLLKNAPKDMRDRCRLSLGLAQLKNKQEDAGQATLLDLIKQTRDPHLRADVRFMLARHFEQAGQADKAREYYNLLLDDPRHKAFAAVGLARLKPGQ